MSAIVRRLDAWNERICNLTAQLVRRDIHPSDLPHRGDHERRVAMNRVRKVIVKLPALPQNLALLDEPITRLLMQHAEFQIEEAEIYNVRLAVQELCANIIRHAYNGERGTITLTLEMNPTTGCFTVVTQDKGKRHFDWAKWTPPDIADLPEQGFGMWLILQLMDEVNYQTHSTSNQWHLAKFFQRRTQPPELNDSSTAGVDTA